MGVGMMATKYIRCQFTHSHMVLDLERTEVEQCLIRKQLGLRQGLGSHSAPYKFNSLVSTGVNSPFAKQLCYPHSTSDRLHDLIA